MSAIVTSFFTTKILHVTLNDIGAQRRMVDDGEAKYRQDYYAVESLLSMLASDSPELTTSLSSSAASYDYLTHLASCSLDELRLEGSLLKSQREKAEQVLSDSLHQHKMDLAGVFAASSGLGADTSNLDTLTADTIGQLPNLTAQFTDLVAFSNSRMQARSQAKVLFANQERIFDLLQLPNLFNSCVRKGAYSEAMDIAHHLRRLNARYGDQFELIRSLDTNLTEGISDMTRHLIQNLQDSTKLPVALKSISYLRSTTNLRTPELKYLFLLSRWTFLSTLLNTVVPLQKDSARYLKRYIEIIREHAFAIFSMFKSIFPANEADDYTMSYTTTTNINPLSPAEEAFQGQILSSFAQALVAQIIETLETHLPNVVDATVRASLLTQVLYCSQSLARVGVEFEFLLDSVFTTDEYERGIELHRRAMSRLAS